MHDFPLALQRERHLLTTAGAPEQAVERSGSRALPLRSLSGRRAQSKVESGRKSVSHFVPFAAWPEHDGNSSAKVQQSGIWPRALLSIPDGKCPRTARRELEWATPRERHRDSTKLVCWRSDHRCSMPLELGGKNEERRHFHVRGWRVLAAQVAFERTRARANAQTPANIDHLCQTLDQPNPCERMQTTLHGLGQGSRHPQRHQSKRWNGNQ